MIRYTFEHKDINRKSCDTKLNILCVYIMFCAISTHLAKTKVFYLSKELINNSHLCYHSWYGRYSGTKYLEIIVAVIHFHINDTSLFLLSLSQMHICHLQIPLCESRKWFGMVEKSVYLANFLSGISLAAPN